MGRGHSKCHQQCVRCTCLNPATIGFSMTLTVGNRCDLPDDPTAFNYKYFCHIFGMCSLIY